MSTCALCSRRIYRVPQNENDLCYQHFNEWRARYKAAPVGPAYWAARKSSAARPDVAPPASGVLESDAATKASSDGAAEGTYSESDQDRDYRALREIGSPIHAFWEVGQEYDPGERWDWMP